MGIDIDIETEQGYIQGFLFSLQEFLAFNRLLETGGKEIIGERVFEVDDDNLILYKSDSFNGVPYTGPSYVMDRKDAIVACQQYMKDQL